MLLCNCRNWGTEELKDVQEALEQEEKAWGPGLAEPESGHTFPPGVSRAEEQSWRPWANVSPATGYFSQWGQHSVKEDTELLNSV